MITFGHEKYISQAILSVLMQETDFDFELIISNDCSPDNTDIVVNQIIENHPKGNNIKYFSHKNNLGMMSNFIFALSQCNLKYIALCEGDDYWTDKSKLQKQVNFLEKNEDYVVSWTDYLNLNDKKNVLTQNNFSKKLPELYTINFDNIFNPYCTLTLTAVFKKSALDIEELNKFNHSKDNTLYSLLLTNGLGIFMNFSSGVYRIHEGGIFSLKSSYYKKLNSYENINEILKLIPESRTKNIANLKDNLFLDTAIEILILKTSKQKIDKSQIEFLKRFLSQSHFSAKIKFAKAYLSLFLFKK